MALGTNNFIEANSAMMIPEKWANRVNDFYRAELKAANFFEDWSSEVSDGGDIIHMPVITQMAAVAKSPNTEVVLVDATSATVDLTINTHYHCAFLIEDVVASKIKTSYKAQSLYAQNAGYSVAAALEDALLALFSGFSQTAGTSAAALADSDIRNAIAYLDNANVPESDRAFFLHPNVIWKDLQAIDRFSVVQNTNGADPLLKGSVGTLYGIPVVKTSRLTAALGSRYGALAHKSALAFATANPSGMSGNNHVRLQTDYILQHLGTLVVADLIFGVKENRDTSGVWLRCAS
jgi:hypothetical protein